MPKCLTKYHGEIEYEDDSVFHFARGLFGFEEETRFLPIQIPAAHPIVFLQSLSNRNLCFVALPVFVVNRQYRLSVSPEDLALLGLPPDRQPRIGDEVLCLTLITVQPNRPTTANLMAPLIVNLHTREAMQAIASEQEYSHQYEFLPSTEDAVCS